MKQISLFMESIVVGLGINNLCMWMLVEKIEIYYMMAAKIVATAIVTLWNYVMKRKAVA